MNRLLAMWRRLFPVPIPAHDQDCEACAHLDMIGARWKPPEVLLATGVPIDCVSHKTQIAVADLHEIAEQAGLVRQGGES